jgi:predicted O-linked N-acetylglucosamine transferase (SPINDLY family)
LLRKDVAELKQMNARAATHPAEVRKALVALMTRGMAGSLEEAKGEADKEQQKAMQKLEGTKKQLAVREAHRDYNKVLRERLRAFLTLSATVDFDAKLQKSGSKWYFANPAYEQQTEQWKFLYRIGKEPVSAARTFAADWLKELDAKAK